MMHHLGEPKLLAESSRMGLSVKASLIAQLPAVLAPPNFPELPRTTSFDLI